MEMEKRRFLLIDERLVEGKEGVRLRVGTVAKVGRNGQRTQRADARYD